MAARMCSSLTCRSKVPPTQPGGDEDELLQTTGRAGHGQDVRASGDGVAHPRGAAQPIQPTRAPGDSGLGVSPSGVGVMPSPTGVVQQGLQALSRLKSSYAEVP